MEVREHILVPRHIKLNEEETKKVLERFNVTLNQLPRIKKNDEAIRQLGTKPGDVIKIVRKSSTMLESEFYRVVEE